MLSNGISKRIVVDLKKSVHNEKSSISDKKFTPEDSQDDRVLSLDEIKRRKSIKLDLESKVIKDEEGLVKRFTDLVQVLYDFDEDEIQESAFQREPVKKTDSIAKKPVVVDKSINSIADTDPIPDCESHPISGKMDSVDDRKADPIEINKDSNTVLDPSLDQTSIALTNDDGGSRPRKRENSFHKSSHRVSEPRHDERSVNSISIASRRQKSSYSPGTDTIDVQEYQKHPVRSNSLVDLNRDYRQENFLSPKVEITEKSRASRDGLSQRKRVRSGEMDTGS